MDIDTDEMKKKYEDDKIVDILCNFIKYKETQEKKKLPFDRILGKQSYLVVRMLDCEIEKIFKIIGSDGYNYPSFILKKNIKDGIIDNQNKEAMILKYFRKNRDDEHGESLNILLDKWENIDKLK
jgi:hypothetical protein